MGSPEFEEIRQILRETDQSIKELVESQKETDRKFQETDRKFQETDRKFQETDRKFQETDLRFEKTERFLKRVSKQIGNVNTNVGYGAETYFQTALGKSLNFAGIQFDDMYSNLKRKKRQGRNCEFDIVLVNHEAVAIIDAKSRVHRNDVEELATKKVTIFRDFFPEYKGYKVYLGLAGFSLEEDVEEEARTYGVGILKQDGNAVETLNIPLKAY